MVTDNKYVAAQFSMLSKLMEIHGENSFKSKSYSIAAFNIEKLPVRLSEVPHEKIFSFKGIGEAIGKKIISILDTGRLTQLEEFTKKTPPGVYEMLMIKGLGPKKIATIWKEMEIESLGELLYACNENRLSMYKGFGEKTQKSVQESIEFYQLNQGSYLYSEAEQYALAIDRKIKQAFPDELIELTGEFRRQLEIINILEWVTTLNPEQLIHFFAFLAYDVLAQNESSITFKGTEGLTLQFHIAGTGSFYKTLLETSCSEEFLNACREKSTPNTSGIYTSEEDFFASLNLPYFFPYLREDTALLDNPVTEPVVQPSDIKGIIHCHSNWSDGSNTIEELVNACMVLQMEYLVLSDHSKSAFYANGLQEGRIREQHLYIDELNEKYKPFRIFKSIECDILNDGSLDYPDNILSTFDLVIASVHSNFKMSLEKANARLLRAIENPYTTILGHMTGRLLLSRNGYPVDHETIIDACAINKVAIELNAHPRRLDIDWRWINKAVKKGVMISINPDAHFVHRLDDTRYGVLSAQKAGLVPANNLSSYSLPAFEAYLATIKETKKSNITHRS